MRGMTRLQVIVLCTLFVIVLGFVIAQEGGEGSNSVAEAIGTLYGPESLLYGPDTLFENLDDVNKLNVLRELNDKGWEDYIVSQNDNGMAEASRLFNGEGGDPQDASWELALETYAKKETGSAIDINLENGAIEFEKGQNVAFLVSQNGVKTPIPVGELGDAKSLSFTSEGVPQVTLNSGGSAQLPEGAKDVSLDTSALSFSLNGYGKFTLNPASGDTVSPSFLDNDLSFSFDNADSFIESDTYGKAVGSYEGYNLDADSTHSITYKKDSLSFATHNAINTLPNGDVFGGVGKYGYGEDFLGSQGYIEISGDKLTAHSERIPNGEGMYFKAGQNYQWAPDPGNVLQEGHSFLFNEEGAFVVRADQGASANPSSRGSSLSGQFDPDDRQVNVPRVDSSGTCGPGGCGAGGQPGGNCPGGDCGGGGGNGDPNQQAGGGGGGSGGSGEQGQGSQLEQLAQAFQQFASQLAQSGGQQGGQDSGSPAAPPGGLGSYDGSATSQVAEICASYADGENEGQANPVGGICGGGAFEATNIGSGSLGSALA